MAVTKQTSTVIATSCEVFLDGVTLGHTQGAITVTVNKSSFDVNVNDFGPNVPVASFSLGTGATVEVPLAQYEATVLAEIIPEATTVSGGAAVYIGDTTGTNFLDLAKTLIIAPTDGSLQVRFPAAFVADEFSVPFQLDEQTTLGVTFKVIPDPNDTTNSGSVMKWEPNGTF